MALRQELFNVFELKRILGFQNHAEVWFSGIYYRMKFCIYNARKGGQTKSFQVAFNISSPEQLSHVLAGDCMTLPVSLVTEFSPEALAIMELRSQRDIDITVKMYKRCPKFGDENAGPPHRFYMREVDMGTDRELFDEDPTGLPVYEGRMVDLFDHRAKGYRSGRGRAASWQELPFGDKGKSIQPQWHIAASRIPDKASERIKRFRVGFCDVASATNVRALVSTIIPPHAVCGHKVPTITFHTRPVDNYWPEAVYEWAYLVWICVANSFAMDFLVRKKVSLSMTYTILDSLPFPRLTSDHGQARTLALLALQLICTGPEMASYWNAIAERGWVCPIAENNTPPGLTAPEERLAARADRRHRRQRDIRSLKRRGRLYSGKLSDREGIRHRQVW